MLKGIEFAQVRDTIASAFNGPEFDMFLFERLDFDRPMHVSDGPFKRVVTDVLKWFGNEGTDARLIAEVAAVRPHRSDIQEVYKKFAVGLLDQGWDTDPHVERLKALDRYRLAPVVDLQRDGKSQTLSPITSVSEGFQKRVHVDLPELDAWQWATLALKQMRRVCQIKVKGSPEGTGFLVGPDTVLTNHHVLKAAIAGKWAGDEVQCLFDYWLRDNGMETEGVAVPLAGGFASWHIDSSEPLTDAEEVEAAVEPTKDQLDHALIRLARPIGEEPIHPKGPSRGWVRVPATPPTLEDKMPLCILQYPQGGPMKIALDTQSVMSIRPTRIRYSTNTDNGSSGAPCFNLRWSLVALHHFGDPDHKPAQYNQGVPIHAIRARLEAKKVADKLGGEEP